MIGYFYQKYDRLTSTHSLVTSTEDAGNNPCSQVFVLRAARHGKKITGSP